MNTYIKLCFMVLGIFSLTACVGGPGYGYGYTNHIPQNAFNTGKACGGAERVMQDAQPFIDLGSNYGAGLERKRTSVDTNENHGRVNYNCSGHADGNSTKFQGQEIPSGNLRQNQNHVYGSGYNNQYQQRDRYGRPIQQGVPYNRTTGGSAVVGSQYQLKTYPPKR